MNTAYRQKRGVSTLLGEAWTPTELRPVKDWAPVALAISVYQREEIVVEGRTYGRDEDLQEAVALQDDE